MATNQKTLQTRIKLKYGSYENWTENNPILLAGELAAVYVAAKPTKEVNSISAPQILFKVGDGQVSSTGEITGTAFNSLPWASGLAADVYAWAKATLPPVANVTARNGLQGAKKEGTNDYFVSADLVNYTKNVAVASKGTGSKIYAVELDKNGHLMVAVPWTDTATIYTGHDPIEVDDKFQTISHKKKGPATGYTKGTSTASIKGSGATGTIKIPKITVDDYGHVNTAEDESVDIELPTVPTVGDGTLTINVGKEGNVSGTGSFNANQKTAGTITLPVYTKGEVDKMVVGAVQYKGTVSSLAELNAKDPDSEGDFCRVSKGFTYNNETLHPGDLLICETIKSGDTAATWSVIHGEIDKYTWVANSKNADGYVAKGEGHLNSIWATDKYGDPAWRSQWYYRVSEDDESQISGKKHYYPHGFYFSNAKEIGFSLKEVSYDGGESQVQISAGLNRTIDEKTSTSSTAANLATVGSIEREIEKLDYTDAEQANYYVSKVSQTDGVIAVERKKLPDAVAPNSGKLTDRAGTEIFNANQSDNSQIMIIDCGTSSTVL